MGTNDITIGGARLFFNDGGQDGNDGNGFLDLGNIPEVAIQRLISEIEHFSYNAAAAARLKDLNIVTDLGFKIPVTIDEFFPENWNILLFGDGTTTQSQSASSATTELHNAPVILDRSIFTVYTNISALVVKGDSGTPTYVLDTDYELINAKTGEIKILSSGSITTGLALELDYSYAARSREKIVPGNDTSIKGSARLEFEGGINGNDVTWIIQNCELKPEGDNSLSSTEPSTAQLVLNILVDKSVTPSEPFGYVLVE
jgi:hypothetical protein